MRSLLVALLIPALVEAQPSEERAVRAVIDQMFSGMRNADSAMVRATFAPGARFAEVDARATPPATRYEPIDGWLAGIAKSNMRWDEQIYDVQIRVDGDMAQAWAPYTFYLDKKWRHCGVDAMELLKVNGAWKVTQLSDTQRRENCRDPLGTGPLAAPPRSSY